ncbi:MAG TPA: hypothetical protein PKC19_10845, partial [Roseiflexaceae bacterium]|nr:hypothetical protein [Roseiflexaceae bacterium]
MSRVLQRMLGLLSIILLIITSLAPLAGPTYAVGNANPVVTISSPPTVFIGEPLALTVSFDNVSNDDTDVGFGPYVDLFLPAAGADGAGAAIDDGVTFIDASYLGTPVAVIGVPFICTTGSFIHPLTELPASCPIDSQVVVLQLPFGSFTPGQPAAAITVNAQMSDLADLGVPLTIQARGGFLYGNDPLDNPTTDPPVVGPTGSDSVTPVLLTIRKEYVGPEDETASGPNFPRRYRIIVDIADGQTITDFDIVDTLAPTIAFLQVVSTSPGGATIQTTPAVDVPAAAPNNALVVRFASITGSLGDTDAVLEFEFYATHLAANGTNVLNPQTGDDVIADNNARGVGDWAPIDPRDPGAARNAVADPVGPEHQLEIQSIAVQKGVQLLVDLGGAGYTPQDTVQYTIDFQIPDFFAFDQVVITDVISDGQRFDAGFVPTLQVNGHSYVL